jgi:acyl-coenzyme A synthetase/AMP-(fatty) acid ligase
VQRGDRVNIYLGMVPELPIAMLACARIGAPHSVVFGGFSAESLKDRINDAEAKVLITADGDDRAPPAGVDPGVQHRQVAAPGPALQVHALGIGGESDVAEDGVPVGSRCCS